VPASGKALPTSTLAAILARCAGLRLTDRRAKDGETDTAGDGGQPRQNGPAFQDRLVGRAHCAFAFTASNASAGSGLSSQNEL
jgi:hypothetical protein